MGIFSDKNIRPKNYMEDIVIRYMGRIMADINCCKCQACLMDIAAYALNRLPSKYIVTREGEVYSRLLELEQQFETDVIIAIMKAIEVVSKNPRHVKEDKGDSNSDG